MTETIVAAAIRCQNEQWGEFYLTAPPPARHHNLLYAYHDIGQTVHPRSPGNQGFITSTGRYVGREEAHQIAIASGQPLIDHRSRVDGVLFSEDMW